MLSIKQINHRIKLLHVRFETPAAVTMKKTVVWILKQCSSETARYFEDHYRLHLQDRKATQVKNQRSLPPGFVGFLLGLLLHPED
jgi:hypothetical protein